MAETPTNSPTGAAPPGVPGRDVRAVPWFTWLSLGLVGLGVACRVYRFWLNSPIWHDEAAVAVNLAERDYCGLLGQLSHYQVAPLLFLWIEKAIYQWTGPSECYLRLAPLVAGSGALVLFWGLAHRCLAPASAVLAVGILATSQWPIDLSCMIKPYAFDLLAAVLLLSVAVSFLRSRQSWWLGVLALLTPFAVCLSYPAVFVAGATALVLAPVVIRDRDRTASLWFGIFNVLLLASFAGHLLLVGRQGDPATLKGREIYMQQFWHHGLPEGDCLSVLAWFLRVHVGKMFSHPISFNGGGLLGLLLMVLGIRSLLRQGQRLLLALCLLPYALHLLAALLRRYPYGMHPRLEQHLLPAYCLLAGAGLAAVLERIAATPRGQGRWLIGAAAVFVSILIGVAVRKDGCPYEHHDEVAQWARQVRGRLQQGMQPGDRLSLARVTEVCLRWQLLGFADRMVPALGAGQLWVIDQREDEERLESAEPAPSFPDETRQRVLDHQRFRVCVPDGEQHAYRFFCDLYRCEPVPKSQTDAIGQ
jgi:uncharacterized membrane protein